MRLSTITNLAYAITLVLTAVSATSFILAAGSASRERDAMQAHLNLDTVVENLALLAEEKTDEARLYVMRGDEQHLARFYVDENSEKQLEEALKGLEGFAPSESERALFLRIRMTADSLDRIERDAISAYRAGNRAEAQDALFSDTHYRQHMQLVQTVGEVEAAVTARSQAAVQAAREASDFYGMVANIMLALTALMFLAVLYFVLSRRVALPLIRMSGIVNRLAKQDYDVEVPDKGRRDEIGEMSQAIQVFRDNGLERERLDAERRKDQRVKDLILQMMHRIQACQDQDELSVIVGLFMPQIFPDVAGHLFILGEQSSVLGSTSSWLSPESSDASFAIDQCWGLRRGRAHVSSNAGDDVTCHHIHDNTANRLCIPLTALGDIVGLLYLEELADHAGRAPPERLYLELLAENIGLAVANLQLRQRLIGMAKRDALTGLLNRRSLDEALNELLTRPAASLACIMVDIDFFKRFNDRFGHDAGDAVMQYVARILSEVAGDKGKVFRFGGEEFTILLPDATQKDAAGVAERLRTAVEHAPLPHRGRILDPITISLGVASCSQEGPGASLIERADAALLRAKQLGRNRVES